MKETAPYKLSSESAQGDVTAVQQPNSMFLPNGTGKDGKGCRKEPESLPNVESESSKCSKRLLEEQVAAVAAVAAERSPKRQRVSR